MMVLSMLDRFQFELGCGHELVLGRLNELKTWNCEQCGQSTDLTAEPFKTALYHMIRVAHGIDSKERQIGNTVTRAC
jgi:hypothetical protein